MHRFNNHCIICNSQSTISTINASLKQSIRRFRCIQIFFKNRCIIETINPPYGQSMHWNNHRHKDVIHLLDHPFLTFCSQKQKQNKTKKQGKNNVAHSFKAVHAAVAVRSMMAFATSLASRGLMEEIATSAFRTASKGTDIVAAAAAVSFLDTLPISPASAVVCGCCCGCVE